MRIEICARTNTVRIFNKKPFNESDVCRRPNGEFAPKGTGHQQKQDSDTRTLGTQIDKLLRGELNRYEQLRIFDTVPSIYQRLGFQKLPVRMTQFVFNKTTNGKHCVPVNVVRELPSIMRNPVCIMKSSSHTTDGSVVILTDKRDEDGDLIIIIMRPATDGTFHTIPSLYGKEQILNFIRENKKNIIYKR